MLLKINGDIVTKSVRLQQNMTLTMNCSCVILEIHIEFGLLLFGRFLAQTNYNR